MSIIKNPTAISIILVSLLLIKCDSDNRRSCDSVICTEEFRSVNILILHESDSSAFILSDFKVIRVSDNKEITITDKNLTDNPGYYPVTNDNWIDLFKNKFVEIEFKGYINNSLVILKRFIVSADCCHISLVQGDTKFYI